jgi:ubiquinone biosynthesis protein COQ9
MMTPPERSPERDAALDAMLPLVATKGWTMAALRAALKEAGGEPLDAEILFPGGAADMVEAYIDLADRRMVDAAGELSGLRTHQRVRALLAARLRGARPHRAAIRHAAGLLALPRHAALAARCTARTIDAVWAAAGDRSADFSWYTKRATLAAVYSATLLFWLRDDSDDDAATLAFLDRRLEAVANVGKLRKRVESAWRRVLPRRSRSAAA